MQVIEEGGKKRRDARRLPLHVQMGAGATHVCPQTEGVTAWSQPKCRCSVGQVLNILEEGEVRSKQAHGVDKAAGEVRCKQGLEVHLGQALGQLVQGTELLQCLRHRLAENLHVNQSIFKKEEGGGN